MRYILFVICLSAFLFNSFAQEAESRQFADICYNPRTAGVGADPTTYEGSLIADFPERDRFLADFLSKSLPTRNTWGIRPPVFPEPVIPSFVTDVLQWKRDRVLAVAKSYIGIPYRHHYIPTWFSQEDGCGIDCSNFSGWIYNYGLGIIFNRAIDNQARGTGAPGRVLQAGEKLLPGDLIYMKSSTGPEYTHVAMIVDQSNIIDSTGAQVNIRRFWGWYTRYGIARRIIE